MSSASRKLASAAGTIAILAIAACGSGDGPDNTRSQFLARANAICADAKADIARAARRGLRGDQLPSAAQLTRFGRRTVIPRLEQEVAALRRLQAPPVDEGEVKAIVDSVQAALDHSKRQPLRFGLAKDSPYAKPDRLAQNYGLTDCVSG